MPNPKSRQLIPRLSLMLFLHWKHPWNLGWTRNSPAITLLPRRMRNSLSSRRVWNRSSPARNHIWRISSAACRRSWREKSVPTPRLSRHCEVMWLHFRAMYPRMRMLLRTILRRLPTMPRLSSRTHRPLVLILRKSASWSPILHRWSRRWIPRFWRSRTKLLQTRTTSPKSIQR